MQVLSLDFLLSNDVDSVKHAQLWDVVQDLTAIVLLVLHWVVAEVELSQQIELLDVLELEDLDDVVESEVQEAKTLDMVKPSQVSNVVLREIELLQVR